MAEGGTKEETRAEGESVECDESGVEWEKKTGSVVVVVGF